MSESSFFKQNVDKVVADDEFRGKMNARYDFFKKVVMNSASHYSDFELEKSRAFNIRNKAFRNYDKLLVDFETNCLNNGVTVKWARDAEEAKQMVYDIINSEKAKNVIKTKNSVAEEIGLLSFLKMKKVSVSETDSGDFICYCDDERPSDSQHPAAHLTLHEISERFTDKFSVKPNLKPNQLMTIVRKVLKNSYLNADIAITGANFFVSDTGGIVISEDEGDVLKSMASAGKHVVLTGIDRLVATLDDMSTLLPLSSIYEVSGNRVSANYIFANKPDYVVLVDNGRSDVIGKEYQRQIMTCLDCGGCNSICPIFNTIGGHVYEMPVPGPVGTVIKPIIEGAEFASHFTTLCTSCHQCEDYCPVNIKLSDLILHNRMDIIGENKSLMEEKNLYLFMNKRVENRKNMDRQNMLINMEYKQLMKKSWSSKRAIPEFARKTFSQLWKEANGITE